MTEKGVSRENTKILHSSGPIVDTYDVESIFMASRIISASVAWCLAMLTLLVVCGPLLMGIGIARGWNTINGTYSFYKVEDPTRFWPEPNE